MEKEILLKKQFVWGDEQWHIPALHLQEEEFVLDFCIALEESRVRNYFQKQREEARQSGKPDYEERCRRRRENPLTLLVQPSLILHGEAIRRERGQGSAYISEHISGEDGWEDPDAKKLLEHYGLDLEKAWLIQRCHFPWKGGEKEIPSVFLHLERGRSDFPILRFQTPEAGESLCFTHPIHGQHHRLTVRESKACQLPEEHLAGEDFVFPRHCMLMSYTIQPELSSEAHALKDCAKGDSPRPKASSSPSEPVLSMGAVAMVRREAEARYEENGERLEVHTICSSLHFDALKEPVEWQLIIREKLLPDLDLKLME